MTQGKYKLEDFDITDEPYEDGRSVAVGKYDELFSRLQRGQRLVCPPNNGASKFATSLKNYLKRHRGIANPIVRSRDRCADGKAGVWWLGEKPATKLQPGLSIALAHNAIQPSAKVKRAA